MKDYFKNFLNNTEILQDLNITNFNKDQELLNSAKLHLNTNFDQNKFYEDSLFWYVNRFQYYNTKVVDYSTSPLLYHNIIDKPSVLDLNMFYDLSNSGLGVKHLKGLTLLDLLGVGRTRDNSASITYDLSRRDFLTPDILTYIRKLTNLSNHNSITCSHYTLTQALDQKFLSSD